ncbi:MAG: hypothetical protein ACK6D3_07830 [Planctomycetaceae bacterium]|jgi:hypothetical protein
MAQIPSFPEVVTFRDGARLTAADLGTAHAAEHRHRALHVRLMHQAWGVATGLDVTLDPQLQSVVVSSGLAYDLLGRELRLTRPVRLPAPAFQSADLRLVIMADEDRPLVTQGACLDGEPVSRGMRPRLEWREPHRVRHGEQVVLGALQADLRRFDLHERQQARPFRRPRLASALCRGDALNWWPWSTSSNVPLGFAAKVDCRSAEFGAQPVYCVQWLANGQSPVSGSTTGLIGPFTSIDEPSPTQFTLRVCFATRDPADWPWNQILSALRSGSLLWTGVEVRGLE